jgi:hypothetical protein
MKMFLINKTSIAALLVMFSTVLFSCQKDFSSSKADPLTEEETSTFSEESSVAEASYEDVTDVAQTAAEEEGNASELGLNGRSYLPLFVELRASIGDCATVTVSPNDSTYPKTITIDFGDSCKGRDGKVRSGAIVIHLTAPLRRPGSVVTVTFRNFKLNRVKLEGTKVISNLSNPPLHKWSIRVVGGKVTFPNGRGYSFESVKYKKQVAGMDTRQVRDDVYEIEGRARIVFNNGTTINFNTETALTKKVSCPWISDGMLKIKINDRVLYLDYGFPNNGDCDNKALLTWNNGNNSKEIRL